MFSGDRPKNYKFITESADKDENIRTPAVANINDEMRRLIPLTPEWTCWPDYDRVSRQLARSCRVRQVEGGVSAVSSWTSCWAVWEMPAVWPLADSLGESSGRSSSSQAHQNLKFA